jgi:hypothetical protein
VIVHDQAIAPELAGNAKCIGFVINDAAKHDSRGTQGSPGGGDRLPGNGVVDDLVRI